MKIALDTNILVSGLLQSQENPAQVLTLALAGAVQVCHDERILAEYAEVLVRPRSWSIGGSYTTRIELNGDCGGGTRPLGFEGNRGALRLGIGFKKRR
jgi:hypothetical protein